jgi:hypothetical protein
VNRPARVPLVNQPAVSSNPWVAWQRIIGRAIGSGHWRVGPNGWRSVHGSAVISRTASQTCISEISQEAAGPYSADGSTASSQTLNVLPCSGIVRSDIRTSLSTGNTAQGVPFTVKLTLVDSNTNCVPLAGYAIYLWHCNRDGKYSLYSSGITSEDYLRGVQATGSGNLVHTSQLALPKDVCDVVYTTTGYSASVTNLSQTSLATDNVLALAPASR